MHIHSSYSDGFYSPKDIFQFAKEAGLKAISITDHNTIKAFSEAFRESEKTQIEFIPGVELHTLEDKKETHILGYFIDVKEKSFRDMLQKAMKFHGNKSKAFLGKLQRSKFSCCYEGLRKIYRTFQNNLFVDRVSDIVLFDSLKTSEAIKTIKKLGGVSIIAHPKNKTIREIDFKEIEKLITYGLDGMEIYHPSHSASDINNLLEFAQEKGLLMTGGSDFHGFQRDKRIGFYDIQYHWLEKVKEKVIISG